MASLLQKQLPQNVRLWRTKREFISREALMAGGWWGITDFSFCRVVYNKFISHTCWFVLNLSGSAIRFRSAVYFQRKWSIETITPEGIRVGMNLELGTSLPIFLNPLPCYQTRQGLNHVILHAILHVCKTWFVTWTWQCRTRVSDNRVLKRIFPQNRKKRQTAGENW